MLRKIVKYTLRTLIVILLAVLLAPALLYVPAVQDFIRGKAVGYASEALGMDLSVGRIRLAFPLRLTVEETLLIDRADTPALAGRGPVAADPERGRRPQFRTGPDRSPLQRHHGRFGYAPLRRTALARGDPGRPPDPEGRHRPDHTLRRRHLPRPEGIGPCGKDRQHGSAGLVARHPENLGPEHLLRDADRTRGDRTRCTPCRRHGRGVPRPARQPAGQRRERAARPRRLLLPDRPVRPRDRNAARTRRHDALPAVDRAGGKRRADRQPGGVRHAGPPPRRGIRPGVHRPLGTRPADRLGLQPGRRHRPATPAADVHRTQRTFGARRERTVRNGPGRRFALRIRTRNRPVPAPGRRFGWTRHPAHGAPHAALRRAFRRPEHP